jgi:hypothetical protein
MDPRVWLLFTTQWDSDRKKLNLGTMRGHLYVENDIPSFSPIAMNV